MGGGTDGRCFHGGEDLPGELAAAGHLYVIHRGIALYAGKVLTSGKVCGARVVTSWLDTWSTSSHAHAGGHLFAGGSSAEM